MELIRFDDVDFSYLSDEEENHEGIQKHHKRIIRKNIFNQINKIIKRILKMPYFTLGTSAVGRRVKPLISKQWALSIQGFFPSRPLTGI